MRPAEAAKCIGISRATLYELIRSKRLRARKLGTSTLIAVRDLDAFVAGLPEYDPPKDAA